MSKEIVLLSMEKRLCFPVAEDGASDLLIHVANSRL
jgi:hypothetical protein